MKLIEKSNNSNILPQKDLQQGFVNIYKLPISSERGQMEIRKKELAFRNGRRQFQIEEWGIPVEDNDDENINTTINLDF